MRTPAFNNTCVANRCCLSAWCYAVLLLWLSPAVSLAAECEHPLARAVSVQGQVQVRRAGSLSWDVVKRGDSFCPGAQLRVLGNSRAAMYLNNDTFLRLDQQTRITFPPAEAKTSLWLELLEGVAHFMSRAKQSFEVITPYVNAAIEGTEFSVVVRDQQSSVTVLEGRVLVSNPQGTVVLTDGQSAAAGKTQAPVVNVTVSSADAVKWMLYYPSVLTFDTGSLKNSLDPDERGKLLRSLEAYRLGDPTSALNALTDIDSAASDARLLIYRASLKLAVGRVDEAQADIDQALQFRPSDSSALALKAITEVVLNRAQSALSLADRAITHDAGSAAAHLARSYALQAQFDLEGARLSVQAAVDAEPENAVVWSRLAEVRLMFRRLDGAVEAAQRAVKLDPLTAHTQTTLGFAYLIRLEPGSAQQAFNKAIELNQTAPLARLGLGLTLIRDGQLKKGRHQIEIAANLDPGNALIRSYLGKAYYEERRGKAAATQYALAKALDPLDPTAWFYDAILKQSENRGIEALDDLETSIAINDNRAVYRSRLLLDEDDAARSASLARTYDDLGFQRLALSESRKSLSRNPGNFSAHRFLSDSYTGVPRHEIARVSERLQAQLLQPAAVAPVSPSAGETNLLAFEGAGASTAGFNEFNPLFNRKRYMLLSSGVIGSNDTRSGEVTVGAFFNRGMISVGRFQERSDGVRENNDSDQTINNVYGQFRLTPKLSVQGEYRDRDSEFGDMLLRITGTVRAGERRDIDNESWRVGVNFTPSQNHTFLISTVKTDFRDTTVNTAGLGSFTLGNKAQESTLESQHIYRREWLRTVIGAGYLNSDQKAQAATVFSGTPLPSASVNTDVDQITAYGYALIPWKYGEWTIGLDYADIDQKKGITTDRFNPKLGLVLDVNEDITIRLAAFRNLRTVFANNQTIAPTQVAGFNQLFDNAPGSDSWRYGAGMDMRFGGNFTAGLELTWRNVNEIITVTATPDKEDQDEQSHNAYLYWTPSANWAASIEYNFEDFEREFKGGITFPDRPVSITTHAVPFEVRYFHRLGFFSRWRTSYVNQEVNNEMLFPGTEDETDNFWITDVAFGYRLPKRRGIVELAGRNMFDKTFRFQSTDPGTGTPLQSPYYPERSLFLSAQLWL